MIRKTQLLALIGTAVSLVSGQALALAMSNAQALISVEITGITNNTTPGSIADVEIFGEASVIDEASEVTATDTPALGSASVTSNATPATEAPLGIGDAVSLSFDLSSVADGRDAISTAFTILEGFISFDNLSASDNFTIALDITVQTSGSASITGLDDENALSTVEFFIGTDNTDIGDSTFLASVSSDIATSGSDSFGNPNAFVLPFNIELGALESDTLLLSAIGSTDAESVPAPASLMILLPGLLLIRRKKTG